VPRRHGDLEARDEGYGKGRGKCNKPNAADDEGGIAEKEVRGRV